MNNHSKNVEGNAVPGKLLVMGARGNHSVIGTFRPQSWRLVALDAATLQPITATWRYKGLDTSVTATSFIDTDPYARLLVSAGAAQLTLNPLNITGNFPAFCALPDAGSLHAWGWAENGGELRHREIEGRDANIRLNGRLRGEARDRPGDGMGEPG
jgi:hypothetical protein